MSNMVFVWWMLIIHLCLCYNLCYTYLYGYRVEYILQQTLWHAILFSSVRKHQHMSYSSFIRTQHIFNSVQYTSKRSYYIHILYVYGTGNFIFFENAYGILCVILCTMQVPIYINEFMSVCVQYMYARVFFFSSSCLFLAGEWDIIYVNEPTWGGRRKK